MRVLVVDYPCHPFQYDLARALARRGHDVAHTWCASTVTPQAAARSLPGLEVHPVDLGRPFEKYRPARRIRDELAYGWRTARIARRYRPTHLVTSNVPILSLAVLWLWSAATRTPWILWLQDLQSGLATVVAGRRSRVAAMLGVLERFLVRRADRVIAIAPEFRDAAIGFGVAPTRVDVIENWAPIDDLPVRPKDNAWARRHGLVDRFVFLYSGTLGKKHSPELLVALADEFAGDPDVVVVVVAEGVAAEWLAGELSRHQRPNVLALPFQPFYELADVFGASDVLVSLLAAGAGAFSVPSKTLSYLCAGRPILAAIPPHNAAARLVETRSSAGICVDPDDGEAFLGAARRLRDDPAARRRHGRSARAYAEATFGPDAIAARFEEVLMRQATTR